MTIVSEADRNRAVPLTSRRSAPQTTVAFGSGTTRDGRSLKSVQSCPVRVQPKTPKPLPPQLAPEPDEPARKWSPEARHVLGTMAREILASPPHTPADTMQQRLTDLMLSGGDFDIQPANVLRHSPLGTGSFVQDAIVRRQPQTLEYILRHQGCPRFVHAKLGDEQAFGNVREPGVVWVARGKELQTRMVGESEPIHWQGSLWPRLHGYGMQYIHQCRVTGTWAHGQLQPGFGHLQTPRLDYEGDIDTQGWPHGMGEMKFAGGSYVGAFDRGWPAGGVHMREGLAPLSLGAVNNAFKDSGWRHIVASYPATCEGSRKLPQLPFTQ